MIANEARKDENKIKKYQYKNYISRSCIDIQILIIGEAELLNERGGSGSDTVDTVCSPRCNPALSPRNKLLWFTRAVWSHLSLL